MEISREIFEEQRRPRFGAANPERMQLAFWEWMIRGEDLPSPEGDRPVAFGLNRDGKLKSTYGPWRARDLFEAPTTDGKGPIWTFDRIGRTCTRLSGGRTIYIGGEHEDSYDPDFCVYNDVVVFTSSGKIEIYGYPRETFPPTDFHTATLVGGRILIVGCDGLPEDRRPGFTPVYLLDLSTYGISKVETKGQVPGWIHKHRAEIHPDGTLAIHGGIVVVERDGKQRFRRNVEEYTLDANSLIWRRLTNRNWLQFSIRQENGRWFDWRKQMNGERLVPDAFENTVDPRTDWRRARFLAQGVPVSIAIEGRKIEVIIEGDLPLELVGCITEGVRANAEAILQVPCVLQTV